MLHYSNHWLTLSLTMNKKVFRFSMRIFRGYWISNCSRVKFFWSFSFYGLRIAKYAQNFLNPPLLKYLLALSFQKFMLCTTHVRTLKIYKIVMYFYTLKTNTWFIKMKTCFLMRSANPSRWAQGWVRGLTPSTPSTPSRPADSKHTGGEQL